jgi:hypothetical protein
MIHFQNDLMASGTVKGTSQLDIAGGITIEGTGKGGKWTLRSLQG